VARKTLAGTPAPPAEEVQARRVPDRKPGLSARAIHTLQNVLLPTLPGSQHELQNQLHLRHMVPGAQAAQESPRKRAVLRSPACPQGVRHRLRA